ncbi:MAG: hypothetical protein QNL62_23625 [Gammaproteobacteria bacterium]|nr:hypothetical protein [Gammaproteobacteria bacterium]
MNISKINNSGYAVEEITYEEMLSLLESQSSNSSELSPENTVHYENSNNDSLSERLTKSANKPLASWLLNCKEI